MLIWHFALRHTTFHINGIKTNRSINFNFNNKEKSYRQQEHIVHAIKFRWSHLFVTLLSCKIDQKKNSFCIEMSRQDSLPVYLLGCRLRGDDIMLYSVYGLLSLLTYHWCRFVRTALIIPTRKLLIPKPKHTLWIQECRFSNKLYDILFWYNRQYILNHNLWQML